MSSLTDALAQPETGNAHRICGVERILSRLSKAERDALEHALNDHEYTASHIARAIQANTQWRISEHTIRRHRREVCPCGDR